MDRFRLCVCSLFLLAATLPAQGTKIGFAETFALAADRQKAIEQLIPGSEEFYFHQCLHWQNSGKLDQVPALLDVWVQRHGRTARVVEIENRQALLGFERAPAATYAWLKDRLGLRFDAQRVTSEAQADLPTRVDPALITIEKFTERGLELFPRSLDSVTDAELEVFAATNLSDDLLVLLLGRVSRPDCPNLVALVARSLALPKSGGFGSLKAHGVLCQEQLEELVLLRPAVLTEDRFVARYLQTMRPSADLHWQIDPQAREEHLDRLQAFVQRLPTAHNSLKAHVLYHRLAHDRALGKLTKERLTAYLRLPRRTSYANPEFLKRVVDPGSMVEIGKEYTTGFPAIRDDEPLVRACLQHFLAAMDSYEPFAEFVQETWLRRLFAETKILLGAGNMERWYSLLGDAAYYEQLKARVEIEFAPEQKRYFEAEDAVTIDVDVKNVDKLLVKVFVIDSFACARDTGKEVQASIDLDGVVANEELSEVYQASPLLRIRRHFAFPTLQRPGTYVVEFLGNGIASRAVIEKGQLRCVEHTSAAGQVLTVIDERGKRVRDAGVWCAGRLYEADARGEVTIPFAPKAADIKVVLRRGMQGSLHPLRHRAEEYALQAHLLVDREALLSGAKAKLVLRPSLTVAGTPIDLGLLEQPTLTIRATNQDGIESSVTVRDLTFSNDIDFVHEIAVPERLVSLALSLQARIPSLSLGKPVELAFRAKPIQLNAIEATPKAQCAMLGRSAAGYFLEVRGKSGEPRAALPLGLRFLHRGFSVWLDVAVATDANGRVQLGTLNGIVGVTCPTLEAQWPLAAQAHSYPRRIAGSAGNVLRVPYHGVATRAERAVVALHAGGVREDQATNRFDAAHDAFDKVAILGGYVELRGLAPGDYLLQLKESDVQIEVQVTAGVVEAGWTIGRDRMLEVTDREPIQVAGVAATGEEIQVRIANANPRTRVHAFATRYLEPFDPLDGQTARLGPDLAESLVAHPESLYSAGRQIGDEARYILERRYAKILPGNMLQRPGLLLNPWEIRSRDSGTAGELGLGGGAGGVRGGRAGGRRGLAKGGATTWEPLHHGLFANFDFLPQAAPLLCNLRPDAEGLVRVPRARLGDGQLVYLVVVDDRDALFTTFALPEQPLVPKGRALTAGLDPVQHFTEQRRIEFVQAGGKTVVENAQSAKVESYGSLLRVFQLFTTLSGNAELEQFAFLVRWPELTLDEKKAAYSQHACHELHFFLQRKDQAFFAQVVRPYLANKAEKTFFDHYLLDADLTHYRESWVFDQLNVVEEILLTRKLAGDREAGIRRVRELLEVLPTDPEREAQLFATALVGRALESTGKGPLSDPVVAPGLMAPAERAKELPSPKADAKHKNGKDAAEKQADVEPNFEEESSDKPEPEATKKLADGKPGAVAADRSRDLLDQRKAMRQLYRAPDTTRVLAESQYWHVASARPDLVRVNAFWKDFALARDGEPFCSPHLAVATGSLTEMLLALAVVDLPFTATAPKATRDGDRATLEATTPLLLVRQELRPAAGETKDAAVLISQSLYRLDERFRYEGEQKLDNFVTAEFLVGVAYGCQVVVTNPTSTPRKLDLLLQIPRGAVPVQNGFVTRGLVVQLDPFATKALDYAFYFPSAGDFAHYPAHVGRDGTLVAFAPARTLHVVTKPTTVDTTSWAHVAQNGTNETVLAYVDTHNLARVDFAQVAWRLRDKPFFTALVAMLRTRMHHVDLVSSYGILHGDESATREYLNHRVDFVNQCGKALASRLLAIDPIERGSHRQLEFDPLFHARAHRLGRERVILNAELATQYAEFCDILAYLPKFQDAELARVTYYLLLLDRVEEALVVFARIDPTKLATRLQYDYMHCYLDFFADERRGARAVAEQYRDHPVARWRALFRDVLNQLDEVEGKSVATSNPADRTQNQTQLAAGEPGLELAAAGNRVTLRWQNLAKVQVLYYRLDVEAAFSSSPFVTNSDRAFAYVQPSRADALDLPPARKELTFDLPAEFQRSNVLVEVRGAGISRRVTCLSSSLAIQTIESYGQLQVTQSETGKALPKVYVKVYAKLPGERVRFHKDGYTDLRGRFDYASVSEPGTGDAMRYAILVLGTTEGAVIREVTAPGR